MVTWANRGKARDWVEEQVVGTVDWKQASEDEWIGTITGDLAATVTRAPVMDPAALSARYPDKLPQSRFIGDNE